MFTPVDKNMRPLHHIGTGYFALVNRIGQEQSERCYAQVWMSIHGIRDFLVILVPDSTNTPEGHIELVADTYDVTSVGYFLGQDLIDRTNIAERIIPGSVVTVKWMDMLEEMF